MTITATLPAIMPNRQQEPAVFVPAMDGFFAALPQFANQIDIAIAAFNFNSVTDTSITSNAINLSGNKTFIVSPGKSFVGGTHLVIADTAAPSTNSMIVQVVSYTGTTLVVTPQYIRGSGTKTAWLITQGSAPQPLLAGSSLFIGHTGNAEGSTNTKFRRLTTVVTNTGQSVDWTYTDSVTLGGSWTFLTTGIYSLMYTDATGGSAYWGFSRNSAQGTVSINTITESTKIVMTGGNIGRYSCSATIHIAAGAVINAHVSAALTNAESDTRIRIERLI